MSAQPDFSSTFREAQRHDADGRYGAAIDAWLRFVRTSPASAAAHFNLSLLCRQIQRFPEALAACERALRLGLDAPAEALCTMGAILTDLRRPAAARSLYEQALGVDAASLNALINLGGLYEEEGRRGDAETLYRRILEIEPHNAVAIARLAGLRRITASDDELVALARAAIEHHREDDGQRQLLWFALGKAADDVGRYEDATQAWREANRLGATRHPAYDAVATEAAFERIVGGFDKSWVERHSGDPTIAPVFICGMYRSGSTLLEKILAAHPGVTAGGELDLLPWLIGQALSPYPDVALAASPDTLRGVAREYIERVRDLHPDAGVVTDKRPDNFLHVGLIKALFPRARIINTVRAPRDNALSIYFQPLAGHLRYATDMASIRHYRGQHDRLMRHWRGLFGEDVITVDYDRLVREPEAQLRPVVRALGLDWDPAMLEFHREGGQVATASLWQVRQPLHTRSSGRWRNYPELTDEAGWS